MLTHKETWGPGPWIDEPDYVQWVYKNLPCLAVRNMLTGSWCGYVAVPSGHPWHGLDYDHDLVEVRVHGGLTFAGESDDLRNWEGGDPPLDMDDAWWFGFDCCHAWDYSPALATLRRMTHMSDLWNIRNETYRDLNYVVGQTQDLADQLISYQGEDNHGREDRRDDDSSGSAGPA